MLVSRDLPEFVAITGKVSYPHYDKVVSFYVHQCFVRFYLSPTPQKHQAIFLLILNYVVYGQEGVFLGAMMQATLI